MLRVMKLTGYLFLAACLHVSAAGYSQEITLSEKNAPLQKIFRELQRQSGYDIVFTYEALEKTSTVSLELHHVPLRQALEECLKGQGLSYRIMDRTVIIKKSVEGPDPQLPDPPIPPGEIHGRVTNEKGAPLSGASVLVKGSGKGMETGAGGEFTLKNVSPDATIVISFTGYETREIRVRGLTEINVVMVLSNSKLDEVQIIAYGTTTQRFNVGSVSRVTSEVISQQPVTNVLQALEGRVPGLVVTQNSGLPGATLKIQVRGQNSLRPGNSLGTGLAAGGASFDNPLFVVDGVPFAPQNGNVNQYSSVVSGGENPGALGSQGISPLNSINPSDIESIDVLRDADATAIYGSRGANGVILITTKKGKSGKASFSGNIWTGASSVPHTMPMMNTQQYLAMRREAFKNDGITPNDIPYDPGYAPDLTVYDTTRYTDWKKFFMSGTARTVDASSSLSGGTDNTQFFVGAGYHHETYIYPGDFSYNRASVNAGFHHQSTDRKLNVDFSANYSSDRNNSSGNNNMLAAFSLPPDYPALQNPDGSLNWNYKGIDIGDTYYAGGNPLAYLKQIYRIKNNNLISSVQISYDVLPGLSLRSFFGYNTFYSSEYAAYPMASQDPVSGNKPYASFGSNNYEGWDVEPQLEYKRRIGKGRLNIIAGSSFQKNSNNSTDINASNYSDDLLLSSISGAGTTSASDAYRLYKYIAVFGRINYIWDNRYILNLSGRRDGSSRFGPGRQFGNFGGVGAGWIFSQAKAIRDGIPILSFGKLRTSYGTTGSDAIPDYQYLSSYVPVYAPYQGVVPYKPQTLYNPDFSWALTKKFEAGVELGFVKDRILVNITWYQNRSSNQLVAYRLPIQAGFSNVNQNAPYTTQNRGWEIQVLSTNIKTSRLSWSTAFTLTISNNKLLSFPGIATSPYANTYVVGKSLNVLNKFVFQGVNDTTGFFQFASSKGTTTDPVFYKDFQVIGDLDPKFYGGLSNTVSYMGFQLNIFLQFTKQMGPTYLNQVYSYNPPGMNKNLPTEFLLRWQKPGDHSPIQQLSTQLDKAYSAGSYFASSSGSYGDASFIRFKTLSLYYAIPPRVLKATKMGSCRVYVNMQNLFTITSYQGHDPENKDFFSLPPLRTITAGLQFTF